MSNRVFSCAHEPPQPVVLAGIELTILRWPDGYSVQLIRLGLDCDELDWDFAECPPADFAAAVAAAVARVAAFVSAGGKDGGQ